MANFSLEFEPVPDSCTGDNRTAIGPHYCSAIVKLYATILVRQIKRTMSIPPFVHLRVKSILSQGECCPEIVASCDENNEAAIDWIYGLEMDWPESFDEQSTKEFAESLEELDSEAMGW